METGDRDIYDPDTSMFSNLSRDMLNHKLPSLSLVSIAVWFIAGNTTDLVYFSRNLPQ